MYDIIIIWWWASGLFCSIFLPKNQKKLILEKSAYCGIKVLMSWWERCNVSNLNVVPDRYTGIHTQALHSMFTQFSYQEMCDFLEQNNINTKIEDNWRIILQSERSKDLLDFLVQKSQANNTEILTNHEMISIKKEEEIFTVSTNQWEFTCKKLIIATWGKSISQVGATDIARKIAEEFNIKTQAPYPCLCWIETKEDLSSITGNSIDAEITISQGKKIWYTNTWRLLFTHRWISWPLIFNATVVIGNLDLSKLEITIKPLSPLPQKIEKYFLEQKNMLPYPVIHPISLRPRTEAKVTWWWIILNQLKPNLESKKIPWLYFLWEAIDITGETGGFNLQRCWTSAYNCAKDINK